MSVHVRQALAHSADQPATTRSRRLQVLLHVLAASSALLLIGIAVLPIFAGSA